MMHPILRAQYVAACASVESCCLLVTAGHVEFNARYYPSDALEAEFVQARALIVGALGWALPLTRPNQFGRSGTSIVQWRSGGWGSIGAGGKN